MSEPDVFSLSSDQKIHEAALAAHGERKAAKRFQNQLYWYRTVKENLMSERLGIVTSRGGVKVIDAEAAKRHEHLKLPDGRAIRELKTHELMPVLDKLRIPNFSHTMSRSAAILLYAEFVEPIAAAGAAKALNEWLAQNRGD
jgi:hypothetical protein